MTDLIKKDDVRDIILSMICNQALPTDARERIALMTRRSILEELLSYINLLETQKQTITGLPDDVIQVLAPYMQPYC